jgi:Subtilisin inhibitor-like
MKPLLTRAFARNVPTATLIAASGLVLTGVSAGPALAQAARPGSAPRAAAASTSAVVPGGPMIPVPWRPEARLMITVRQSPSGPVLRWTLTCRPDGGTLPDPARACRVLYSVWDPFTPVRTGVMCPMIVYGPQLTTISGYWRGAWISVRFSRTYSCQAWQWMRILSVLPPNAGQVNPGGPMLPGPPG